MDAVATEVGQQFHTRFKEIVATNEVAILDRTDMEWLPRDQQTRIVNLALVRRQNGQEFYLGSAVVGNLVEYAEQVGKNGLDDTANKIFYAAVERYLDFGRTIESVQNARSKRIIKYEGIYWTQ